MKRLVTVIGGLVVVLLVVIGAAVFFLYSNLDSLVKTAVEEVGSRATGATVTLDGVELSPSTGEGALRGLVVGNPKGFRTKEAATLGEIKVSVDISTLGKDTVVVKEVVIDGPQVTYETGGGASNLDTIKNNVDAFARVASGSDDSAPSESKTKVVINDIYIRNGRVSVSAPFLAGKSLGAPLPEIHLKDVGKDEGGATPAQVADAVGTAIIGGAGKAVASIGELAGKITGGVVGAASAITKGAASGVEKGAGAAKKVLEEGTKGVGGAIKGLFKK